MTAQAYSGKMLVAAPSLDGDEIFSKSVVYIYQQKEDLVLGLVLNKPSKLKVSDVYKLKSGEPATPMPEHLYKGGPVNDQSIILLHDNNWNSTSSTNVGHGLAVSSDELMLEKILTGICRSCQRTIRRLWRFPQGTVSCAVDDDQQYR